MRFLPEGSPLGLYAPMAAQPMDDLAWAFYGKDDRPGIGQFTHYLLSPDLGDVLGDCLDKTGFRREGRIYTEDRYEAVFFDRRSLRRIAVLADSRTVGMLVAERTWAGDVKAELATRMGLTPE